MAAVVVRSSRRRVGHERSAEGFDAAGGQLSAGSGLVRRRDTDWMGWGSSYRMLREGWRIGARGSFPGRSARGAVDVGGAMVRSALAVTLPARAVLGGKLRQKRGVRTCGCCGASSASCPPQGHRS